LNLYSFNQVKSLELQNVGIVDPQSIIKFKKYLKENSQLNNLQLDECGLAYDFIKDDFSSFIS